MWVGQDGLTQCDKDSTEAPSAALCELVGTDGIAYAEACCLQEECWQITGGCAARDENLSDENRKILESNPHCDTEQECTNLQGHEDWAIDVETCQLHPHAEREGDATIDGFMMIVLLFAIVFVAKSAYDQWQDMQAEQGADSHADQGAAADHEKPAVEEMDPVKYIVLNTATVRRGPDADSDKLGELKAKQMIECVEKTTNAAGLEAVRMMKKGDGNPLDGGWVKTVTSKGKQLLHQLPGAQFPGDPSPHMLPKKEIESAIQESLSNLSLLPDGDIDAAKVLQQLAYALQVPIILHTDAHKHQRVLKSVSLFSAMPPAELKPIVESIEVLNFYAGQEVISEDARDQDMYVVMEGTAECTKLGVNDGGPIAQYSKGDFFGERAALANEPRAATVSATSDLTVLKLDRTGYNAVLDSANANVDAVHSMQKKYEQTCGTPPPRQRRQNINALGRSAHAMGAHGGPTVMGAMRAARRRGSDSSSTLAPAPSLAPVSVNAGAKPGSPRRYSDPEVSASANASVLA